MGFFKTLHLLSSSLKSSLKEAKKENKIEQEEYNEDFKKAINDIKIGGIEYIKIDVLDTNKPYYNIVKREINKLSDPADIYRGSGSFNTSLGDGSYVTHSGGFTSHSWKQESIRAARREREHLMELTDIIYKQTGKRNTIEDAVEELQICIRFCNLRGESEDKNASSLRSYLCLLLKEVHVYQKYEKECLFYDNVELFKKSKEGYMIKFLFEGLDSHKLHEDLTHDNQTLLIKVFTDITKESRFNSERYDLQKIFHYLFQEMDFKISPYDDFIKDLFHFQFDDFDLSRLMEYYQLVTINTPNEVRQANLKCYNDLIADYKTLKYMSPKDIDLYFEYKTTNRLAFKYDKDVYAANQIDSFSRRFNLLRDELYQV
jgi:hypothetical protein